MIFTTLNGTFLDAGVIDDTTTFVTLKQRLSRDPFEKIKFISQDGHEVGNEENSCDALVTETLDPDAIVMVYCEQINWFQEHSINVIEPLKRAFQTKNL